MDSFTWMCQCWQLTRTYLQQLYTGTGCSQEDLLRVMNDRDEWGESQGNPC